MPLANDQRAPKPSFSKERVLAACVSLILIVFFIIFTRLIPSWGTWYSSHLVYRWETERMLGGQVALSLDPSGMDWDLAWGNGSVQQMFGLAVPLWRLPLEAIAKAIGQPAFPDRFAFLLALAGVTYFVTRFHFLFSSKISNKLKLPWPGYGLMPTIQFPPFLALCSSRFLAYEEVEAYGFLVSLLLLTWTAWLWFRPNSISFLGLAMASGLIAFLRPTLGVYGAASLAMASLSVWQSERNIKLIFLAGCLFLAGSGLLCWSNAQRFGSPIEFGHSLAINGMPQMGYATRFENPYHTEPLISAAKELFALLFLTRSLVMVDSYGPNLFAGQSHTFRWRELYFTTYDLAMFLMIAVTYIWLARRAYYRLVRKEGFNNLSIPEVFALWSVFATVPLAYFYLRFPFISSRYLLDFAPAFSAASWVFFLLALNWFGNCWPRNKWMKLWVVVILFGWWGYETMTIEPTLGSRPLRWKQVAHRMVMDEDRPQNTKLPLVYTNGFSIDSIGIRFNGMGWNQKTGNTAACVVLFVENPECLTLDLAAADKAGMSASDYDRIQAKIGLEILKRKSITSTAEEATVKFYGPRKKQYQSGIQIASLAMMSPQELNRGDSKFRLLKVSWHRDVTFTNAP
jgi:hypothetical protein